MDLLKDAVVVGILGAKILLKFKAMMKMGTAITSQNWIANGFYWAIPEKYWSWLLQLRPLTLNGIRMRPLWLVGIMLKSEMGLVLFPLWLVIFVAHKHHHLLLLHLMHYGWNFLGMYVCFCIFSYWALWIALICVFRCLDCENVFPHEWHL